MPIPIRCESCGRPVANKTGYIEEARKRVETSSSHFESNELEERFNALKLAECCRKKLLTYKD